jgi:hypothetical protein
MRRQQKPLAVNCWELQQNSGATPESPLVLSTAGMTHTKPVLVSAQKRDNIFGHAHSHVRGWLYRAHPHFHLGSEEFVNESFAVGPWFSFEVGISFMP